jgi:diacylglycerol kinase
MKQTIFNLKSLSPVSRLQSLRFACNGIRKFFREEPNAWVHLAATILLFIAIYYFRISGNELMALVIVTGFVWVAEAFNTALERIMDFVSPGYNPKVEVIKDIAAGAVLLSAITAILTGAIVFIPKIF